MLKLIRLWLREVFSHRAFLKGNILLCFTITIFTLSLTFSESMIHGISRIMSDEMFGTYTITVAQKDDERLTAHLNDNEVTHYKYSPNVGIVKASSISNPLFIKTVTKDYFTGQKLDVLNIKTLPESGLLLSLNYKDIGDEGVLFLSDSNRARLIDIHPIYSTGLSHFDDNVAYLITDDVKGENISHEVIIDNSNGKRTDKSSSKSNSDALYNVLSALDDEGVKYKLVSKSSFINTSASTIEDSRSSIYLISFLFALLSAFYSLSLTFSYIKDNRNAIRMFKIYGMRTYTSIVQGVLTVEAVMLFFILIGFILGVTLSTLFPHIIKLIASIFNINLGYYLLSFPLMVPIISILKFYAVVILLSLILSLSMFITHKKSV